MNLAELTSPPLWTAVGLTMLHYLWIGGCVGIAAAALRRLLVRRGAATRYGVAVALFAVLALLPLGIFAGVWSRLSSHGELSASTMSALRDTSELNDDASSATPDSTPPATEPKIADTPAFADPWPERESDDWGNDREAAAPLVAPEETADDHTSFVVESSEPIEEITRPRNPPSRDAAAPATVETAVFRPGRVLELAVRQLPWLWLLGTPVTFLLLSVGLVGAARLRSRSRQLDDQLGETCRRLAESLQVTQRVTVAVCDRVLSPVLVGIVRPVILLPPAALVGWTPEQIELVLLHELAHVRRHDNLVNLCQRIVEALLFYQPAVWLISDWIRREREHCCDELVVAHSGRAQQYAELLTRLAEAHAARRWQWAGSLSSPMARSHLVARVRYLLFREYEPMQVSAKFWSLLAVGMIAILVVAGWQTLTLGGGSPGVEADGPIAKRQEVQPAKAQPVFLQIEGVDESSGETDSGAKSAGSNVDIAKEAERRLSYGLGVKAKAAAADKLSGRYRGGLEIIEVADKATAGKYGLRRGDILVGIHVWEVKDFDDAAFVFSRPEVNSGKPIKFYIQRDGETLFFTEAAPAGEDAGEETYGEGGAQADEEDPWRSRRTRAASTTPKELLRYDGKTFAQWREEWRTELKPARRREAIAAFRVFAANGFGPEAAQVIIDVMRSYDVSVRGDEDERALKTTAVDAFDRIEPDDALPALMAELRDGNRNGRLFALSVIGDQGHRTKAALPAVLSAAKDDSADIRKAALETAADLVSKSEAKPEEVMPTVIAAFEDENTGVRVVALNTAVTLAPNTKELLPAVRKWLKASDAELVVAAVEALVPQRHGLQVGSAGLLGADYGGDDYDAAYGDDGSGGLGLGGDLRSVGTYVPELLDALKHRNDYVWQHAAEAIYHIGSQSKEAVPSLLDMMTEGPLYERQRARLVLERLLRDRIEGLSKVVVDELAGRLKSEDRERRLTALLLLNELRASFSRTEVIPLVTVLLSDDDDAIRQQAQRIFDAYESQGRGSSRFNFDGR